MRVGKIVRFGSNRATINLDIYNAFNSDAIRTVNTAFAQWSEAGPRPTANILARFVKISTTFDF
jgi:hypothetical protein